MNEIGALLGSGKEADVHAYGDHALKLYKSPGVKTPAFREAANLAVVERLGLPAPHVYAAGRHDGRWGIVMDRAPGASFGNRIKTEGLQPVLAEMVQLQLRLHAVPGNGLASLKDRLTANIRKAPEIGSALREILLWQLAARSEQDRVCHGDFHPWNIHGAGDQAIILDWLDACCGDPLADACRSYLLMLHAMPEAAHIYLEIYAGQSSHSADEILAWLPLVAAARLTEGVDRERDQLLRLAGSGSA